MTGRCLGLLAVVLAALTATATPALAKHAGEQIVLPGATSAEGIAKGAGATFYAGDLFTGDIYRGNLQRGTAELFVDARPVGWRSAWPWTSATGCCSSPAGSTAPLTSTTRGRAPPWRLSS